MQGPIHSIVARDAVEKCKWWKFRENETIHWMKRYVQIDILYYNGVK